MKCAIFDWGDRFKCSNVYFDEFREYLKETIKEEKDEEVLKGLNYQIENLDKE